MPGTVPTFNYTAVFRQVQAFLCCWFVRVDSSSTRPQVDDTVRPSQWFGGRWSGWAYDAEVLSLW